MRNVRRGVLGALGDMRGSLAGLPGVVWDVCFF